MWSANSTTKQTMIPESVTPAGLRQRANIMRGILDESCARHLEHAADEIERLRGCLAAIQKATVDGQVCDDVAWFDSITTLHDFCDFALNGAYAYAAITQGQSNP